jgi:hypothetical protein
VLTLFALSNLWQARHRLLAMTGEVRPAIHRMREKKGKEAHKSSFSDPINGPDVAETAADGAYERIQWRQTRCAGKRVTCSDLP